MMSISASKFFKTIKEYHANIDDDFEQSEIVIPKLRAYQRRAVKWMLNKEKNNDCELIKNKKVITNYYLYFIFKIYMLYL